MRKIFIVALVLFALFYTLMAVDGRTGVITVPRDYAGAYDSLVVYAIPIQGEASVPINSVQDTDTMYFSADVGDTNIYLQDTADYMVHARFLFGTQWITTSQFITFSRPTPQGDGSDTLRLATVDTANSLAIDGVTVTVRNASGFKVAEPTSDGSGIAIATLKLGDAYSWTAYGPLGYIWGSGSTAAFALDTTTIEGYPLDTAVSALANVCAVTVNVIGSDGQPREGVEIKAYLERRAVTDSAGHAIANVTQVKRTDSNGQAVFQCIYSNYLIPATKWRFSGSSQELGSLRESVTIPSQASYTLDLTQ